METDQKQKKQVRGKRRPIIKMGHLIKEPKIHLKKAIESKTILNTREPERSNINKLLAPDLFKKEEIIKKGNDFIVNNNEKELYENEEEKKRQLQEFNDVCFKIMLSNHLDKKR